MRRKGTIASWKDDKGYGFITPPKGGKQVFIHTYAEQENFSAAAANAVSLADGDASKVPAAMIYIQAGDLCSAKTIAYELTEQADAHSRAYGQMLKGMILESEGAQTDAILAMRGAIATADLWLVRCKIGKAYLRAEGFPEALDELTMLNRRHEQATRRMSRYVLMAAHLQQMPASEPPISISVSQYN